MRLLLTPASSTVRQAPIRNRVGRLSQGFLKAFTNKVLSKQESFGVVKGLLKISQGSSKGLDIGPTSMSYNPKPLCSSLTNTTISNLTALSATCSVAFLTD